MTMRRVLLAAAAAASSCPASSASPSFMDAVAVAPPPSIRRLEDADGNSYAYLDDLSGLSLAYGKCVRVKIPQENDNDDDGNVYFYNGRYHAPSVAYASFYLCDQAEDDRCGACDFTTQYATELGNFLDRQVEYVQGYCGACAAQCRRRRRRAEDEEEGEGEEENNGGDWDGNVDCDTCVDQCALLLAGNEGNDETYYLECQEHEQDENGVAYYTGPACDSDTGGIVVGLYYDEDCTIKSQQYDGNFAFNTFETIASMCVDCSDGGCDGLYQESYHCVDGYDRMGNENGDDGDMPVCKTFKKASKEWTYATAKSKNKLVPVLITVLILGALSVVFSFLSYTYYVRHKRAAENNVPMASLDQDNTVPPPSELPPSGQLT